MLQLHKCVFAWHEQIQYIHTYLHTHIIHTTYIHAHIHKQTYIVVSRILLLKLKNKKFFMKIN